ncbi:MAG TPA: type I restriction-modification system subunit M [Candidatus Pacearchaeota archaeon]|nr:type I restriction-modification system subunit M [Candidatus Pacearchaeota archaeon]
MAIKKSQLYSSIWQGCDELRGGMDASQYKDYVLVLLFVRYVSDKYAGKKNSDVIIPKGGSFADLVALKGKPNVGEGVDVVLSTLAEANGLKGVIDSVSFNDPDKLGNGKEMVDRITKLIAIFENTDLDFSHNRAEGDDLLGDAYEFLMKHFAVESGKSKGQFYTPAEVSRIIAKVIGARKATGMMETVYDPACGSGSLLLKIAAETPTGISIYGQELDNATAALAKMNMWLHSQPTAEIAKGQSTLSNPLFLDNGALKTFDFVVANPPFSYKAWRNGFNPESDLFDRFTGFGIPPAKSGDFAFLLHILRSMKSTGKGAVILPHGVLFRGNAEANIRKNVIQRGYIKGIIGLPANLFYGTGIPACIIVLDKSTSANRKGIFMIDASKGFVKDGNKNRLREQDIKKIVDTFNGQLEIPKYSRFVPNEEIQEKGYNLNLPRYINTQEAEDIQNIEAHLNGGVPIVDIDALSDYWQVCPTLKKEIFKVGDRKGFMRLTIPSGEIKNKILANKEFDTFRSTVLMGFNGWRIKATKSLREISTKDHPKAIIEPIANDLLTTFGNVSLVNKYDVYQHLMEYWGQTMQDDVYIITVDGWTAGNQVMRLQKDTKKGKKDIEGLIGLEGRLIPISLLIKTYFDQDQKQLDDLSAELEQIAVQMDELKEEYGGEDGLLTEVIENDKVNRGAIQRRMKEIKSNKDFSDELAVLEKYSQLFDKEVEAKGAIKSIEADLERKIPAQAAKLSIDDIKNISIEQKWLAAIEDAVRGEIDQVSQRLSDRIKVLALRYEEPLPMILDEVNKFTKKVEGHLAKMGFNLE